MNRQSRAFHTRSPEEVADFGGAHLGVAGQFDAVETLELVLTSRLDAGADGGGGFDLVLVGESFVVDAGDFDVDVDTIEEGAADSF